MSTIKEIWYGQRSLAETYWIWGILLTIANFAGGFAAGLLSAAAGNGFPLFLFIAISVPTSICYQVGLWRSATNHPSGWATLVKVLIVIAVPFNLITWANLFLTGLKAFKSV